jgi:transposase-like protein
VRALLDSGLSVTEAARALGISKSTACYHKRRLGRPIDDRFNRRYEWDLVQAFYDEGRSITECQERFGFARKTFMDAVARGLIRTRSQLRPIDEYLVKGREVNRTHLKSRLLAEGLKENRCERCGIGDWVGAPLSMALHHVNGDGDDNRLENLMMLCPNCHAQTPNFSGRNRRLRRLEAALVSTGAAPLGRETQRRLPLARKLAA